MGGTAARMEVGFWRGGGAIPGLLFVPIFFLNEAWWEFMCYSHINFVFN
jgi:hypothetical protein